MADERLQRRGREVERRIGRHAAAPGRAVFAVGPQRRQRRRRSLALLVDELHPAQERPGEPAQPGVPLGRLLEASLRSLARPVRQVGLVDGLRRMRPRDRRLIVGRVELGYNYRQLALLERLPSPDAARMALRRAVIRLGDVIADP